MPVASARSMAVSASASRPLTCSAQALASCIVRNGRVAMPVSASTNACAGIAVGGVEQRRCRVGLDAVGLEQLLRGDEHGVLLLGVRGRPIDCSSSPYSST